LALPRTLSTCKSTNLAGTTVLINGEEVDETLASVAFVAGDYVEIILDTNVIGAIYRRRI